MDKVARLMELLRMWSTCQGCELHRERNSVVFGYGNPNAQVVVVGEAPGKNEDQQGVPFVGQAGMLLDQYFASVSIHPDLLEMAKDDTRLSSLGRPQRGQRGRLRLPARRERKLNMVWQSGQ